MQTALYNSALRYKQLGISTIATDGNKRSVQPWRQYQDAIATDEGLQQMFQHAKAKGLAIICGAVSGGLEVIDVDCKYDNTGTLFDDFMQLIVDDLPEIAGQLVIASTKGGGYHVMYRCPEVGSNTKLARRATTEAERASNAHDKVRVLIETRGEGGYVIAAPTDGYAYQQGTPAALPVITPDQRAAILEIARSFNTLVEQVSHQHQTSEHKQYNKSPFQDYNERGDILGLLQSHGWKLVHDDGNKVRFQRPGNTTARTSGDYCREKGLFAVFTTSTVFEPQKGYRPAAVYCMLECNGDWKVAGKALVEAGFGEAKRTARRPAADQHDGEQEGDEPAVDEDRPSSKKSIIHQIEEHLHSKYSLRRNVITRHVELNGRQIEDRDVNTIWKEAAKVIPKVTKGAVQDIIFSNFTPDYNPFDDFFEQHQHIQPSGVIERYFRCLASDTGLEEGEAFFPDYPVYFGTRWLVGLISSIHGHHSPLMLVLTGPQGNGKTEFFRRLFPTELKPYFAESKMDAGKDDDILMCKKAIIFDDEMSGKSKKEEAKMKSILSREDVTVREPYGRASVTLRRICTFCGTTNNKEVLRDPTGNRRIIPINVLSIDFDKIDQVDRVELIMEAYWLWKGGFKWELSGEDIKLLNDNTGSFENYSTEYEMLASHFSYIPDEYHPSGVYMTYSEMQAYMEHYSGLRLNREVIQKECQRIGWKTVQKKIRGINAKRLYVLQLKGASGLSALEVTGVTGG